MAFASKIVSEMRSGGKRMTSGSWTSNSTSGGDIETGLVVVENIVLTPNKSSVTSTPLVVNETFPLDKGQVTIVTASSVDGVWEAIGH